MTATVPADVASLRLPPKTPLPYRQRANALRPFHTGMDKLRNAGGPVTDSDSTPTGSARRT